MPPSHGGLSAHNLQTAQSKQRRLRLQNGSVPSPACSAPSGHPVPQRSARADPRARGEAGITNTNPLKKPNTRAPLLCRPHPLSSPRRQWSPHPRQQSPRPLLPRQWSPLHLLPPPRCPQSCRLLGSSLLMRLPKAALPLWTQMRRRLPSAPRLAPTSRPGPATPAPNKRPSGR